MFGCSSCYCLFTVCFADWGHQGLGPSECFATGWCFRPKDVLTLGPPWSRNRRDLTNLKFHCRRSYHDMAMAIVVYGNLTLRKKWHLRHRHHGIQKKWYRYLTDAKGNTIVSEWNWPFVNTKSRHTLNYYVVPHRFSIVDPKKRGLEW